MKRRTLALLLCLLLILPVLAGCTEKRDEESDLTVPAKPVISLYPEGDTAEEDSEEEPEPSSPATDVVDAKPVIYLYPEEEYPVADYAAAKPVVYAYPSEPLAVSVRLEYEGELTVTYPAYGDGWEVLAYPDGTIIDRDGKEYSYLFWEGESDTEYDLSKGFCVAGADTAEFLQETLAAIGLTPREYNEFIVYWLPKMQDNAYNLITFQTDCYTEAAKLIIDPAPDSLLRVFMVWQALDKPVEIPAPAPFTGFEREGFTVVEWGGCELTD